jgi:hypothetical protein
VILRSRGIELEQVEKAWKAVSAQSERQFGAFHFLYLIEHGSVLNLEPKIPEIRNRVVHRGMIAQSEEALQFGELVFARIKAIEESLKKNEPDVKKEQEHEVETQKQKIPVGMDYVVLKTFSGKVDTETKQFAGYPETFQEYLAAVHQGKESGWIA